MMMNDEEILAQTKQSFGFDLFAVIFVLIIPINFIFFSNQIAGVFIGIVFLAFVLYGIVFLYNKLYRNKLTITKNGMIYENKYFLNIDNMNINFDEIKELKIEQTFFNRISNIGKLTLILKNDQNIILINLNNINEIADLINSLKK